MNSILEGKRGNTYEDEYVVYQLLRLLEGHLSWMQWEDATDATRGIDLWIHEQDRTIAIQCKHHSEKSWKPSQLAKVRRDARLQLEGDAPNPIDEFRFVSDARADGLDKVFTAFVDMPTLEEVTTSSARRVAPSSDPRAVKDEVLRFGRLNFGKLVRGEQLAGHLRAASIALAPDIGAYDVQGALATLREEYIQSVYSAATPLPLERILQPEVESVVAACQDAQSGDTIILHGSAGSGKSTILAVALENLELPVLALRADRDLLAVRGFSHDPVAMFASYCGDRKGALLIDQLDQLRVAGSAAQATMDRVRTWIRRSKECGLVVLVGCRTVDAERDTQLRQLLDSSQLRESVRIRVQDLPEATVVSTLSRFGIAAAELDPGLLRLLARPLPLALLLDLRTELTAASRCNTTLDLMRLWWERVTEGRQEFDAVLNAMCDFMESEGRLSCPARSLPHPHVVAELRQNGILQEDEAARGRLRPFHQFLTDTRIAVRWGSETTPRAVLESIGSKKRQSVAQARRLRLATSLIAERAEIVQFLMESDDVRPLLKRALLTGISDLDDPGIDIVRIVKDWLSIPTLAPVVAEWVIHGRPSWAERLETEIDEVWRTERVPKEALIRLLFSVDDGASRLVDRLLKQWSDADKSVLDRARPLFRADPGNDSEERFEARLRLEALTGRSMFPRTDWQALVSAQQNRAVRLLAERLKRSSLDDLIDSRQSFYFDLPADPLDATGSPGLGQELWSELADWWRETPPIDLDKLETGKNGHSNRSDDASPIVAVVEFLAAALAADLGQGKLELETLMAALPSPLRDMDAWLLLAVSASLPAGASNPANRISQWFIEDPRWCSIDLGPRFRTYDLKLPKRALQKLGDQVSDEVFAQLEAFIATYPDEWTVSDEEWRRLGSNLRGRMAYELLPALPQDRLSERSRRLYQELQRKFGHQPSLRSGGGYVRYPVPDEIAATWTDEKWIEQLRTAPQSRNLRFVDGQPRDASVFQLSSVLRRLAHARPSRYLSLARSFDADVPASAREAIVSGLGTARPPDGRPPADWAPIEDREVASFLEQDAFLHEPEVARALAWAVRERPRHRWSQAVLDRLQAIGQSERPDAGTIAPQEEVAEGFASYRLNNDATVAVEALAAVAAHHPDTRASLLPLAARLADHEDPARRSSAAILATACESADPKEARRILLHAATHSAVAAEWDVAPLLFRCATDRDCSPEHRATARDLLLRLADSNSPRVQQLAGEAVFQLRAHGVIDDTQFTSAIEKGMAIRVAAANATARALHVRNVDAATRAWLVDTAIEFAREGSQAGSQIIFAFRMGNSSRLLEDQQFVDRLLDTKSAKEFLEPLLVACDRSNHLLPVAHQVLSILDKAVGRPSDEVNFSDGLMNLEQSLGLVSRLVEEAEAFGDGLTRDAALDMWDRLLEANPGQTARTALNEQLSS